ncbi:MAG: TonB family protein [Mariniphaga sp.]|nr:TonB family protein [Mariniphaga sp.]
MSYFSKHKRGIFGSTIFHLIILILLIWLGFFTPLPLPGEEGIMVNFGTSDQGFGQTEPSPAKNTPPVVKEEEKKVETTPPLPVTTPPPVKTDPAPSTPAEEVAMTQDYEETVAIDAAEKKKKEEEDKIKRENEEKERLEREAEEKERLEKEAEEKERLRLEEIEKERLAKIERLRQEEIQRLEREAELERQRLAEIERQRQEEEKKINEINSRTRNAFENSGSGGGETGSGEGESQGTTYPGGNQGVPTGSPNSSTYGQGGSGSGDQGSGISYSLSGRTSRSLPKPDYPGNEEGTVVVQVTVDKNGNVTKAEAGVRGSTTMNSLLLKAAREAALKARFNIASNAPAFQVGSITYKFSLQ